MTHEQEIQALANKWRAFVGRLPRAVADDLPRIVRRHGGSAVSRAVTQVSASDFRRTKDRLRLFYAYFGEAVPPMDARP